MGVVIRKGDFQEYDSTLDLDRRTVLFCGLNALGYFLQVVVKMEVAYREIYGPRYLRLLNF